MTPVERRRVLIATYFYPPQNIIGARRPYGLAKWLRRAGHEVAVLTSVHSGRGPDDAPHLLLRTRDLLATRLNWRRGGSLEVVSGRAEGDWEPGANLWGAVFVPDVQLLSWAPFAVGAARRLARAFRPDVVVTTSPVESVHAVGLALQRDGVAWIADLRDGWRFEAPRAEWPLPAQRRLDAALERLVVGRADAVVTVTAPLAAELRGRLGAAPEVITNGFDPDDEPTDAEVAAAPLDRRRVSLVHTGGLGGQRTLRPLLDALARLAGSDPSLSERVEVVLAGTRTVAERELYGRADIAPFVRHLGFVDRRRALALQRAADVLLLVTSGVRRGEATGKLFEYLAAARPILVIGHGSAAGDIVRAEDAGLVIPTHDTVAAETALRRLLAGDAPSPAPDAAERYLYPALAERYAAVMERAIGQRRSRGAGTPSAPSTVVAAR